LISATRIYTDDNPRSPAAAQQFIKGDMLATSSNADLTGLTTMPMTSLTIVK
jgi:hypothetical protein